MREDILSQLEKIPDPRRAQGRRYPLKGLLALLLIAAINGESSLRGMWVWGCDHWKQLRETIRDAVGLAGKNRSNSIRACLDEVGRSKWGRDGSR